MFNLATEYCFSLDKNSEKNIRCFLMLLNLEGYINGAIIEMNRLNRVRKAINKSMQKTALQLPKKRDFYLTYLKNDTHFYFICIDKVYKLLKSLSGELNDSDIKNLVTKLEDAFDIKTVRDHLEHIEQRCLGRYPRENKGIIVKNDLGNFWGDYFSFGGKKFPSGKDSLSELKKIYSDLIGILTKKYASKDSSFIIRQQQKQMHKKIMRKLKNLGLY